ncbi:MAG: RNA polymerase sigma factor [Anaerolineae bacterium]|nr:RNA polymerase sigma factor [Anaerolineae bacterium]
MDEGTRRLQEAKRWDESALGEIYDTYAPLIYRYVYRKTGDRDIAQDLTAETFHRFLKALRRGTGPRDHLSGWLYRVAHNLVVDHYRSRPKEPAASLEDVNPAVEPVQAEMVARKDQAARVRVALQQLTPLQQKVVLLRFLEEMSLREVALALERTVGSVKALQHRAVSSLQRILEDGDEE